MRPKRVVLHHIAPTAVHDRLPVLFGPHSIHPVIFLRKTSTRPADHGHADRAQSLYYILTDTVDIRDMAPLSHI